MKRGVTLLGLLAALAVLPSCGDRTTSAQSAGPAAAPAGNYQALVAEYDSARAEFSRAYSAAKTDAARQQVVEKKYPQPQKFAGRFLELAQKNPDDPAAVDALVWVVDNARNDADADKALPILRERHVLSDKIGSVCQSLVYSQSKEAEPFLREVLAKNPSRDVQGQACFSLACVLKRKSADEADKLFTQAIEKYGDVKRYRGTLADAAKGELFELHNLAIGKVAPEIEGQDVEGKSFKLSDYRGKVTVIDFWGDW